ncbi:MAG: hypothetical protein WBG41_18680 [Acidimicrobiales bacterium]
MLPLPIELDAGTHGQVSDGAGDENFARNRERSRPHGDVDGQASEIVASDRHVARGIGK